MLGTAGRFRGWFLSFVAVSVAPVSLSAQSDDVPTAGRSSDPSLPSVMASEFRSHATQKVHPLLLRRVERAGANAGTKAWVFFEDTKDIAEPGARRALIDNLKNAYNRRAIQRRRQRRTLPGLFDIHDLPVPERYVDAVAATGAQVHVISKWINAVSVSATRRQITAISELPFVTKLQPVRRGRAIVPGKAVSVREISPAQGRVPFGPTFYGESEAQLTQIDLVDLHAQGFTGSGVIVGILDTGFKRTHQAFNEPGHRLKVVAEWDFINNDGNTTNEPADHTSQHNHGSYILGVLGSFKPELIVGGAYDASFILCKTEDITAEYRGEEDNYVAGLEFIEANGGDMATASLGYTDFDDPDDSYGPEDLNGLTAVTTIGVNIATGNGVHCCNSAGNGGHDADPATLHLVAPADALEVLAVGAVDELGVIASFSSDGPSADGRVKPEVLARGINTRTPSPFDDTGILGVGGTSLSTPLVASAVACLIQAHPDWTVEQMRRYLTRTASDYVANGTFDPLFTRGYGIIDAAAAGAADCNDNSIDDAFDVADGTSLDCNANGIPDECDISDGTLEDTDGDGVADVCPLPIPSLSQWGVVALSVLTLVAGCAVIIRRRPVTWQ